MGLHACSTQDHTCRSLCLLAIIIIRLAVRRHSNRGSLEQRREDQGGTRNRARSGRCRQVGAGISNVSTNATRLSELASNDNFIALLYPLSRGSLIKAMHVSSRLPHASSHHPLSRGFAVVAGRHPLLRCVRKTPSCGDLFKCWRY